MSVVWVDSYIFAISADAGGGAMDARHVAADGGGSYLGGPAGEFDSSRPCIRGAHAFLVPEDVSGPPGPVPIRPGGCSRKDPQSMFET